MPIYEYQCGECQTVSEFLEGFNSASKHVCEKCGSEKMSRVMSVFSATMDGKSIVSHGNAGGCSSCSAHNCSTCGKG